MPIIASADNAPGAQQPPRLAAIDALRGLGALAIACYHIHRYEPLPEAADAILPKSFQVLVDHGWLAVPMFLVVAGFVTAYTLRKERLNLPVLANFAGRRVLRLGAPYWTVLLLVAALSHPAIHWLRDPSLTDPVTWPRLLASVLFLQDVLGYGNVSAGMWFVCIDLQLGILLVVMLWLAQALAFGKPRGSPVDVLALSVIFVPLAVLSLFVWGLDSDHDMWPHYFFYLFFLGILASWALEGRVPSWLFWGYVAVLIAGLVQRWPGESVSPSSAVGLLDAAAGKASWDEFTKVGMAIVTGIGIYGMGRAGRLSDWVRWSWLQYLGKISYSLFLIHYPVSWAMKAFGYWFTGDQPVAAVCWLVLALLLSLGAADLLYRFVEGPSLRLVHGIKLHQFRDAGTAALPAPASESAGTQGEQGASPIGADSI